MWSLHLTTDDLLDIYLILSTKLEKSNDVIYMSNQEDDINVSNLSKLNQCFNLIALLKRNDTRQYVVVWS